jgi:Cu/Ag efflux protein CusF
MKRMLVGVVALFAAVSLAWAAETIEGKIKDVNPTGSQVTLDDGTQLTIPNTVRVSKELLKEGATVRATFETTGGQNIVKSIEVRSPQK